MPNVLMTRVTKQTTSIGKHKDIGEILLSPALLVLVVQAQCLGCQHIF